MSESWCDVSLDTVTMTFGAFDDGSFKLWNVESPLPELSRYRTTHIAYRCAVDSALVLS